MWTNEQHVALVLYIAYYEVVCSQYCMYTENSNCNLTTKPHFHLQAGNRRDREWKQETEHWTWTEMEMGNRMGMETENRNGIDTIPGLPILQQNAHLCLEQKRIQSITLLKLHPQSFQMVQVCLLKSVVVKDAPPPLFSIKFMQLQGHNYKKQKIFSEKRKGFKDGLSYSTHYPASIPSY